MSGATKMQLDKQTQAVQALLRGSKEFTGKVTAVNKKEYTIENDGMSFRVSLIDGDVKPVKGQTMTFTVEDDTVNIALGEIEVEQEVKRKGPGCMPGIPLHMQ